MTYYIKNTVLPIDEDSFWEFKAHRNFSSDEIPAWRADGTKINPALAKDEFYKCKNANRTRQPISRNLSGFLNAGKGGKILIGVLDSGRVVGIGLSSLQKDHLLLSLEDAMRRFKPAIPYEFITVSFVPVLDDPSDFQHLQSPDSHLCDPPEELKRYPHQLRTSSLCWCDDQAMHRFKLGFMTTLYVVELTVAALHPQLRTPQVSKALHKLMENEISPLARLSWPGFTSEDGNLYNRCLNCLVKETKETIEFYNDTQTVEYVKSELEKLESGNESNLKHLQTLIPADIVISKSYLKTILENNDCSNNVNDELQESFSSLKVNTNDSVCGNITIDSEFDKFLNDCENDDLISFESSTENCLINLK